MRFRRLWQLELRISTLTFVAVIRGGEGWLRTCNTPSTNRRFREIIELLRIAFIRIAVMAGFESAGNFFGVWKLDVRHVA